MTAPATEKAAPIPAEVREQTRKLAEFVQSCMADLSVDEDGEIVGTGPVSFAIVRAINRADRQEERIREDEREACAKVAEGWLQSSWQDEVFAARSIADAIRLRGHAS